MKYYVSLKAAYGVGTGVGVADGIEDLSNLLKFVADEVIGKGLKGELTVHENEEKGLEAFRITIQNAVQTQRDIEEAIEAERNHYDDEQEDEEEDEEDDECEDDAETRQKFYSGIIGRLI